MKELEARAWDKGIVGEELRRIIQSRRVTPDGKEVQCGQKTVAGRVVHAYPWHQMMIGDYFFVKITGSYEAMATHIRQTGARLNIEFAIRKWVKKGEEHLRVIKVMTGLAEAKEAAGVRSFDAKRRAEYIANHKRGVRREARKLAVIPISEPTVPQIGNEPTTEFNADHRAVMEQRRLDALKELAGLDPDDPDFMGVTE